MALFDSLIKDFIDEINPNKEKSSNKKDYDKFKKMILDDENDRKKQSYQEFKKEKSAKKINNEIIKNDIKYQNVIEKNENKYIKSNDNEFKIDLRKLRNRKKAREAFVTSIIFKRKY